MNKRKKGYYWIKRRQNSKWEVAHYDGWWKMIGNNGDYTDYDFYELHTN